MRLFPRLFLALVFLVTCLSPARAETRVALVIGNSDYKLISSLANPENDAALMAETLREVGFEVIEAKNADWRAMKRAIRDFGRRLDAAGKDGVGLFYYAGHAVEARGVNYLIPLDAPIEREGDLDIEAVSAQRVLTQMKIAGNGLNVVILDSCRNNPYKGSFRAASRGLAKMDAPTGSYIAYAAAPGKLAADGVGSNSPYTAALAAVIKEPGLKLEDAFKRVRVRVHEQSGGKQRPWEEGSVIGDFYFVAPESKITVNVQPEPSPPAQAPPAFDVRELELALWKAVEDSADPAAFEDYLAQYPSGVFSGSAKRQLKNLKRTETAALTSPFDVVIEPGLQKRVALVIGNSRYENEALNLQNPARDAKLVAEKLRRARFGVLLQLDLSVRGTLRAVRRFGDMLQTADVGLFYYAGHAIQMDGRNYMVPTDSQIRSIRDVPYELVDMDLVVGEFSHVSKKFMGLVVLDATLINPFKATEGWDLRSGLAKMTAPPNTLIAFATEPNTSSYDGGGKNSPYTQALARHMLEPNLEIQKLLIKVRKDVRRSTQNQQFPWEQSSLLDDFYFVRN